MSKWNYFKGRQSAGKLLAKRLTKFTKAPDTLVLGIPRGGVVVAAEIAKKLQLPLDIVITRKIGAPMQKELALGAVDPDGEVIWDEKLLEELRVESGELKMEINHQAAEIKRREQVYRVGRVPLNVLGKTIILVDDGIATGATATSAVRYLKRHQVREIILAVPVAAVTAITSIIQEVDEVVVLTKQQHFKAVGQFYHNFEPVLDEEVIKLLLNTPGKV